MIGLDFSIPLSKLGEDKKKKRKKEKDPVTTPCLRAYFAGGRVSN